MLKNTSHLNKKKFELKDLGDKSKHDENDLSESKVKESLNFQEFVCFSQKDSEEDSDKNNISNSVQISNLSNIHNYSSVNYGNDESDIQNKLEQSNFSNNFKDEINNDLSNNNGSYNNISKKQITDNTNINDKSDLNMKSMDRSNINLIVKSQKLSSKDKIREIKKQSITSNKQIKHIVDDDIHKESQDNSDDDSSSYSSSSENNYNNKNSTSKIPVKLDSKTNKEKNVEKDYEKQRQENNKNKLLHQKIAKREIEELMKLNEEKIKTCQQQLYFDCDEKNDLIKYVQATGNLDTRMRDFPSYIILPNSRFKWYWDIIILLCAIYSIIMIPIDVGWNISCVNNDIKTVFEKLDLIIGILFLTDVGLNFITAILDEKFRYIFNIQEICFTYIKTLFLFDVISAMPYSFFISFDEDKCFNPQADNPKLILVLGLFRIIKASKMFTVLEELFSRYATIIRLLKLFLMVLYFAHCTGNILVGNSPTFSEIIFSECNLLNSLEDVKECRGKIVKARFYDVYTYSVFAGYFIISGNELHLKENWEKLAFVGISVVSMGLTASIFGNVAILISNMSFGVSPVVQEKIDVMKEYMSYMKYEKNFIDTIEKYHVNIWSKQRTMLYSEDFFGDLNSSLMKMILIDQWKPTFFVIGKWMKLFSNQFFINMIPKLKPKIFMKKDVIITEGDSSQDVYFISSTGQVSIKISGQWVKNMKGGEMFGEISIFLRSRRRTATVTSLNDSDYLVLSGEVYEECLRDFPETSQKIKHIGINRLMSSIKLYPSFVFAKLVPKNDLRDYLIRKSIYLDDYQEDELFSKKKENFEQVVNLDKYERDFHQVKTSLTKAIEKMQSAISNINSQLEEEYTEEQEEN